jgi:two-component system sensor histidine kinase/response regulator
MPDTFTSESQGAARGVVLVVDDRIANVQVVGGILTREGYEVIAATSGEQALQRVAARPPDLVLLDVIMPGMDGFELCRRLQELPGTPPPIIFLSAADEKDTIIRAFECGGVDYVTKPFNKAELLARVRAHVELKLTHDTLRRTFREKNELMSMVAHDLKNPLAAIRLNAMLLAEQTQAAGGVAAEMTASIVSVAEEMLRFIERFLSRKAGEAEQEHLLITPVDAGSVCTGIAGWERVARAKDIRLTITPPDQPVTLNTDRRVLTHVLDNLVSNAVKFTPRGGRVEIRSEAVNGSFVWTVKDSGPGFTADDLKRAFTDYTRLSAEPTGGESSTGLGLAIARRLAGKLGATVEAATAPEGGAVLKLTLPMQTPL